MLTIVGPFVDDASDETVYAKCRFVACSGKSYEFHRKLDRRVRETVLTAGLRKLQQRAKSKPFSRPPQV